jgi:two-component system, NarL family, sensor kinase
LKTTEVAIVFITGTLTLLVFVFFLVLIVIEYRRRQVRHITEKLELKHQYQNEVLQTQLEVQEQSFKYVSEEIHDNIAQTLSLVKLKLYKTAAKETDGSQKTAIEGGIELLGTALNDLRNLSHILNGGLVSKLTLKESIEKELNYVKDVKDIQTGLTITGSEYELNAERKLMTFRIVQEAINNAIKHGAAAEINISLAYQPGILKLRIADNGRGFDTGTMDESKGLGLHNMHVRARLLGAITIQSVQGKGTNIILNIVTDE